MPDMQPSEMRAIFHSIGFKPEFGDTHGGCPPVYLGGELTGIGEAVSKLTAYHHRIVIEAENALIDQLLDKRIDANYYIQNSAEDAYTSGEVVMVSDIELERKDRRGKQK